MKKEYYFLFLLLFFLSDAFAQDLVYKPKNPAFGGDTFNYQWLLSSAEAQDVTVDESTLNNQGSTLDDFTESLNRQLLSQLSRELVYNQFGDDGLEDGTYSIGNFQIDVTSTLDGLSINIFDSSVGDVTQIFVPFY